MTIEEILSDGVHEGKEQMANDASPLELIAQAEAAVRQQIDSGLRVEQVD